MDNLEHWLVLHLPYPLTLILLLGAGLLLGAIAYLLSFIAVKYLRKRLSLRFIQTSTKLFKIPLLLFLPTICIINVLSNFPAVRGGKQLVNFVFKPLLVVAIALFFMRAVAVLEEWINKRFNLDRDYITPRSKTVRTQLQFIRRLAIIVISTLSIAIILMNYESMREIATGILASAGIISAIVAFAAQNTFSNILAGFQVAFTQPIRIDDIVIAEGEFGQVEEINLTYVVLRVWDQRRLVLPLNYFIQKPFQNWSRYAPELLGTVILYVDYGIDLEALRSALSRILEQSAYWDRRANTLQITDATEKSLQIRALVSAKDAGSLWNLRCEVREKLLGFIVKNFPGKLPRDRFEVQPPLDTHSSSQQTASNYLINSSRKN